MCIRDRNKKGVYFDSPTYIVNALVKGCPASDTIKVSFGKIPPLTIGRDTSVCNTHVAMFMANIDSANYLWSNGSNKRMIFVADSGKISLRLYKDGCTETASAIVKVLPLPIILMIKDTTFCNAPVVVLNAYNPQIKSYQWQDGTSDSVYLAVNTGRYTVKAIAKNGCIDSASTQLTFLYTPVVTLGNDTTICPGEHIILCSSATDNYEWFWQDGSRNATFNVLEKGIYTLTATNICGSSTDTLRVTEGVCTMYIPSAFTPNGDGVNDRFKIRYTQFIQDFQLFIFDRKGKEVFETKDAAKGWDGTKDGKQAEAGTYIWKITITDRLGKQSVNKGSVVLIR